MAGPKIKNDVKDKVSSEEEEILFIHPEHEARFKGMVASYVRSSQEARMKHPEPKLHRAVIRGIAHLLRAEGLRLYRAELQLRLTSELRLDRATAQAAISQVERTLKDMKRSRPLGRASNTP